MRSHLRRALVCGVRARTNPRAELSGLWVPERAIRPASPVVSGRSSTPNLEPRAIASELGCSLKSP
jgi:hypothetical protein